VAAKKDQENRGLRSRWHYQYVRFKSWRRSRRRHCHGGFRISRSLCYSAHIGIIGEGRRVTKVTGCLPAPRPTKVSYLLVPRGISDETRTYITVRPRAVAWRTLLRGFPVRRELYTRLARRKRRRGKRSRGNTKKKTKHPPPPPAISRCAHFQTRTTLPLTQQRRQKQLQDAQSGWSYAFGANSAVLSVTNSGGTISDLSCPPFLPILGSLGRSRAPFPSKDPTDGRIRFVRVPCFISKRINQESRSNVFPSPLCRR